jgi:hypothetical protein
MLNNALRRTTTEGEKAKVKYLSMDNQRKKVTACSITQYNEEHKQLL